MARKATKRPTDAELAILGVLWDRGPCTVREVQEQLAPDGSIGYTTVLKTLQIMTDKQLVLRDEASRAHVYRAKRSRDETQSHLVSDLAERAFDGSTSKLVLRALSSRPASRSEIAEIRRLLDEFAVDES